MDLDARPYRCFAMVAETGSFRRAAARLNLSQPALSAQIRELERRLGFALFERSSRSVSITSEGRLFLPNARRIIGETEIANRAAFDIRTNQLRIAASLFTSLIAERRLLVERFMCEQPGVPLRVLTEDHARGLAALRVGQADLAFAILPSPMPEPADDIVPVAMEWLVLAERPMMLSLPADHPLAAEAIIPAEALRGLKIARLGRTHGRGLSDAIAERLLALGAEPVRPPEGHAIAVEQYAYRSDIAAVSIGWTAIPGVPARARVRRPVEGLGLRSCLALIRNRGARRAGADSFWQLAEASQR
jgi:DNA-binding transcriptional LysR family regulator